MWRNLKSRFFVASGRIVVVVEIGDWSQERTLSQPMRPDWRLESACSESQRQCYNLQQTTTVQNTFPAPPLIHLCLFPVKRLLSVKAAWRVNPMSRVWKVHLWQEIYQISILLNWPLADYISPDTLTLSPGTFINLPSDQREHGMLSCAQEILTSSSKLTKSQVEIFVMKVVSTLNPVTEQSVIARTVTTPADWAASHPAYYPIKCFLALLWNRYCGKYGKLLITATSWSLPVAVNPLWLESSSLQNPGKQGWILNVGKNRRIWSNNLLPNCWPASSLALVAIWCRHHSGGPGEETTPSLLVVDSSQNGSFNMNMSLPRFHSES